MLTIDEWCAADGGKCPAGTTQSFFVEGLTNPESLTANTIEPSWEVLTANPSSYPIDGAYSKLKPLPDLKGVEVKIKSVIIDSPIVGLETIISVTLEPGSDLPNTAFFEFTLPTGLAVKPSTERCYSGSTTYS